MTIRKVHSAPTEGSVDRATIIKACNEMIEYTVKVYEDKTEWLLDGKLHREGDKPAIECADGSKAYYKNDKLHREGDKPAIEYANGTKRYYKNGKCHREGDLPALEFFDGTR